MSNIIKATEAAPLVREGGKLIAASAMTAVGQTRWSGADIARAMEKAGSDTIMRCMEMGITKPELQRYYKLNAMKAVRDYMLANGGKADGFKLPDIDLPGEPRRDS